jgi:hypothetical protein
MILAFHPDIPGKQYDRPYKFLGYWHSVKVMGDKFGMVVSTCHGFDRYEEKFGPGALPLPNEWVDTSWDAAERERVVVYLKNAQTHESWRGNSFCRFEGCETTYLAGHRDLTDGTYVWPEAFHHYVDVHGVKPPQEFVDHVMRRR